MIKLEDITVYNDIRERLAQVTPQQVEASLRRMPPGNVSPDDLIGVIQNPTTKALYTLWLILEAEAELEQAKSHGSHDETEELAHAQQAALVGMWEDVVGELFWAQAKIDLGFHERHDVGLRSGWRLVKEYRKMPKFLAGLMTGTGVLL
jgi:hypothetical protein